ncbi:6-pyruvoyl tetrahydrobiopterin synthase [Halotydeus destructor]|nr:6-pyruvoyl tetrahydrobiopterin synthase [Halotydeus destructor]
MSIVRREVFLTRIESFCAAHRLHSSQLSNEDNSRIFGKCNNPAGHGHNYKLEVTVRGLPDLITGMVINIADLKIVIKEQVLDLLDHKNIDKDVDWFRDNSIVSTAENICSFIWQQLVDTLPNQVKLHSIKLYETDKNVAEMRE